jgi:hypothetical protein
VCKAAVLYVFRTLVDDDIPLNAGCLETSGIGDSIRLDAESPLSGGGGGGQCGNLPGHCRCTVWRIGSNGGFPGHHE